MSPHNTKKRTHSNVSNYPLPSLCSSLSSHNSSSKSLVLFTSDDRQQIELPTNNNKKRWDESQLAIELCDDKKDTTSTMKRLSKLFPNNHHSNSKQLSCKFTTMLRKIKSMKSL